MNGQVRGYSVHAVAAVLTLGAFVADTLAAGGAYAIAPLSNAATALGFEEEIPTLARGLASARQLDTANDAELCATGAIVVDAPVDEIADGFRTLRLFKESGMSAAAGRLSNELTPSELDALPLPAEDVKNLSHAKIGNADIKLSEAEIAAIQKATGDPSAAFKSALLDRVRTYRSAGLDGLGTYSDKKDAVRQRDVSAALLTSLGADKVNDAYTLDDSFDYWSVEQWGSLKPIVSLTHMSIYRRPGAVRIETVQLYASHYCEGLVTSIDLVSVPSTQGESTLVRLTFRSQVDALGGMMGGLKRKVGRSRMVEQVAAGLERMRAAVPRAA